MNRDGRNLSAYHSELLVLLIAASCLALFVVGCGGGGGNALGGIGDPCIDHDDCEADLFCGLDERCYDPSADGDADGDSDGDADGDSDGDADGDSDADVEPTCADIVCSSGQRCEIVDGEPSCLDNSCDDLDCADSELCQPAEDGPGNVCVDNSCDDDLDCPPERFCNGEFCEEDVCEPGEQTCVGDELHECLDNGSGTEVRFTCGSDSYFVSECDETGDGEAECPCEDDWDCPAYTVCEVGVCVGTGRAPTCSLPPEDFSDVLPQMEEGFPWGGTGRSPTDARYAEGSPFPQSAQVVMTPVVINLDDDNGDGLINELDFPEILFLTFCSSEFTSNGILRAVHGGGPNRGGDFFAVCGSTVWNEDEEDDIGMSCSCSAADLDSTSSIAAGDIDGDGVPEIVGIGEGDQVVVYSNRGIELARHSGGGLGGSNPAPTLANVDNAGFAEIIVGPNVFTLDHDDEGNLVFVDRFQGSLSDGAQGQGPATCVANILGDERQEIIAGSTAYRLPEPPPGVTRISECTGDETEEDHIAFCDGDLAVAWDGVQVNGSEARRDGYCAVADVLGADQDAAPGPDNPLDGVAEVLVVISGNLQVYNGLDGTLVRNINMGFSGAGGAPNVDDFDGDGFPEIGSAGGNAYSLIDFQEPSESCPEWPTVLVADTGRQGNPERTTPDGACTTDSDCGDETQFTCNEQIGRCVCLYNGWRRSTEDDSSSRTGSSVFDFNGDGAAEVVYNDECYFRVINGTNGEVLFAENSPSRTRIEYPVVADVDNDGNAEIVFAASNESGFCSDGNDFNNGIEVWGDGRDLWVSARRIWNQHAYHVTNVTEGGSIPLREAESWLPYNERIYNTYRSNPRSFGVAPDLVASAIQISSPDAACGELTERIEISVLVENQGDLRVGPGVVVGFHGRWTGLGLEEPLLDGVGDPIQYVISTSLEPGGSIRVTAHYEASYHTSGTLPDEIWVVVDELLAERECDESNNELSTPVEAGDPVADLIIDLGAQGGECPNPTVLTTVTNIGSAAVSDVLVRFYAGNPEAGGGPIHEELIAGPIEPHGGSVTIDVTLVDVPTREFTLFATVDPDDVIVECNDGNNSDTADEPINCPPEVI